MGLLSELETKFKQFVKNAQGVLVVSDNFVKPNPSFVHILHKGDILIAINKKYISTYDQLAEIIDSNINNILNFCIQRGSEIFMLEVRVLDLHELDLCEYLECGDMVCHAVGLQISRGFSGQNVVCGDVFVASPGVLFESAGIPNRSIIKRINNTQIDNIEHFSMIMTSLAVLYFAFLIIIIY